MYFKANRLLPPQDHITFEEGLEKEKIIFENNKKRRLGRMYRIYMATALAVIGMLLILLGAGIAYLTQDTPANNGDKAPSIDTNDTDNDRYLDNGKDTESGGTSTEKNEYPEDTQVSSTPNLITLEELYSFDYNKVPKGQTAIVPMDLSLSSYGADYIENRTGLTPDTKALLNADIGDFYHDSSLELLSASYKPQVLIVHTHGTEAYCEDGAVSYLDDGSDFARSSDISENVVSVGKTIAECLNEYGIPTVHCEIMHDSVSYKDSYARAKDTIEEYLAQYPSIKLVIDVHRDSVVKSTGEIVRPVALVNGEAAAQVMCVVGSNWGGEDNPNWEGNLALSLQLRARLNSQYENICRPTHLRSATYNQEIAPFSLLLEIGAGGNSIEEATRSAKIVAQALSTIIPEL